MGWIRTRKQHAARWRPFRRCDLRRPRPTALGKLLWSLCERAGGHARARSGSWSAAFGVRFNQRGLVETENVQVIAAGSAPSTTRRTFSYLRQGFLTASSDTGSSDALYEYGYDAIGLPSRTARTISGDADVRTFERVERTLSAGTHHHTFDALGRAIERDDVKMTYGPNGQVASARRNEREWSYIYDEAGQRIGKLVGGEPAALFLGADGYVDTSSWTMPIQFSGQVVGVLRTTLDENSQRKFQLVATDATGTAQSDAEGHLVLASPFGDRDVRPDTTAALDYASKGYDSDLGVVRMGVRDYDPAFGRFTTPDPLFLEEPQQCVSSPAECNLYGYARNQPVTITDPSGMCAEDVCLVEGTVAQGAMYVVLAMAAAVYASQPANQKSFSRAVSSSVDSVGTGISEAAGAAANWAKKTMDDLASSGWSASKAISLVNRLGKDTVYVFATYTVRLADGSMYSGRTAGVADPRESAREAAKRLVAERWATHGRKFDPASPTAGDKAGAGVVSDLDAFTSGKLSKRTTPEELKQLIMNYAAIRGREQQLIDHYGGARSEGGSAGNAINGVARDNPLRVPFDVAAHTMLDGQFGVKPPTWTAPK
jgi:RHS repeat-associated protein